MVTGDVDIFAPVNVKVRAGELIVITTLPKASDVGVGVTVGGTEGIIVTV